jgi:hypothetical protein
MIASGATRDRVVAEPGSPRLTDATLRWHTWGVRGWVDLLRVTRASRLFWVGMLILSVLAVRAALVVPYLPTNDGPQNVLSAHIENHYGDPNTVYAEALTPAPQFAYKGFAALQAPLESLLGWRDALRVSLSVMALGMAWAFAGVVLAVAPERRVLAFAGFALAWTWSTYMGFFAFVLGTAIGIAMLAVALRARELDAKRCLLLGAGLFVDAVAHVFTAAIAGLVIAAVLVARADREARPRTAARVALVGAPAALVLAATVALHDASGTVAHTPPRTFPLGEMLAIFPRLLLPGPSWRALAATALVGVALAIALRRFRGLRTEERVMAVAGGALLAVGLFAPRDIAQWQHFSPRFVPMGALLVLATLPVEALVPTRPRVRLAAAACAFALAAGSLLVSSSLHRRLATGCGDALGVLHAPAPRGTRSGYVLDVVLDPYCGVDPDATKSEIPWLEPLHSIGALYATEQGGLTPYLFAGSRAVHAFVPAGRLPVPVPRKEVFLPALAAPETRRRALLELGAAGTFYGALLVTGATPEDAAVLRDEGFVFDWQSVSSFVAHFEPCSVEVALPAARHVTVEAGVVNATLASVETDAPRAVLTGAPCGEAWVRVRPSDGARCADADPTGRIPALLARGTTRVVVCDEVTDPR